MSDSATYTVKIPSEYGYVVLTAVGSVFMLIYMTFKVVMARKKYKVPYPIMYSTEKEKDGKMFNCVQRAHQNTLENHPSLMMCMLLGGIQHPLVCAVSGVVWLISRIVYAHGYYTGDPAKRNRGSFGYFSVFTLYGCTISFALHILGVL